ncbi:MAG: shikimate dehydrogenase [Candidatus Raymondbacteria bacterium RifOxyA12_full_50_37]|uniref:Shikimate dehydrogenase (NADP(+)) n=1 Tax=Candidatus Raymondbacteria bacterium RIFOXYD12_FULL_49_13 TaxID=1817890 RepID=A0A1F7FB26_UNCRA|nr:MAG: shikimate dehydrogenase [Candidatus Raymondbacteria bacterium RifOxyA12_full_50_37]OGJ92539.1 MAG: shikimate dehydrogenase [Candidatus Raymondbacteria bacterium RIFOXYA2_FULL_49_16]OGJ97893.1 MAG: shikimate dehydrogenase [Candidatus Raymondbacteria bacterium RIFOXYC2_FULL_50_21]OGK03828.1 MAG: shikimate dehydrogenase [Candidatus Raymondbacteria bacterium RIFOXYD12_FULL_49_13]OGK07852.1 MAG: shikimate dehydrogenase [Candidatus Raymondbacteria bacterium RifOxyC12_full_50_8]OGP44778.1 MAG
MINGATRLLGVIGSPIEHTRSPHMHNEALSRLRINAVYVPLKVESHMLKAAVNGLRAFNFLGANVTIPYKEAVAPYLDSISNESALIGAVNTIVNRRGRLWGTTTDPDGILGALKRGTMGYEGKRVTIMGTGGAARTALFTFLLNGVRDIVVAGRRPERARSMAAKARRACGVLVPVLSLDSGEFRDRIRETELLVNATSAGMYPRMRETPVAAALLHGRMAVFDMIYNPLVSRFLREAARAGARTMNGLPMLVYQGMASFTLWTGKRTAFEVFYRKALAA